MAMGTGAAANYVTNTYSNKCKLKAVLDAMNNLTTVTYDGLDRLGQVNFPSTAQGARTSVASDYGPYDHDADGNLTRVRRRSGDVMTSSRRPVPGEPEDPAVLIWFHRLLPLQSIGSSALRPLRLGWRGGGWILATTPLAAPLAAPWAKRRPAAP